jgi:hypothetical protein
LNGVFYVADRSDMPLIITKIDFIALLIKRYNACLLPQLRQVLLIPNRINKLWISEQIARWTKDKQWIWSPNKKFYSS